MAAVTNRIGRKDLRGPRTAGDKVGTSIANQRFVAYEEMTMNLPSTHASLFVPLQRGDRRPDAWSALHARYQDVILTWCRRRGLSLASAEDLAQDIWLKLVHDIHKYDPTKGKMRSWLKAVVNNALTDFWRRQRSKPERDGIGGTAFLQRLGAFASPDAADELSIAIESQAGSSAADLLERVRSRVHETTWQAFYQTLVEKRPAKTVADELRISIAAVYKYTYRVKQMLHEEYLHVHPHARGNDLSRCDEVASVPG
jgi:RNA polymerase sigma-70 factor, ECF subfamily